MRDQLGDPGVLETKKDGTTMFCEGYNLVNDFMCKDVYPLPRIDDNLDFLR